MAARAHLHTSASSRVRLFLPMDITSFRMKWAACVTGMAKPCSRRYAMDLWTLVRMEAQRTRLNMTACYGWCQLGSWKVPIETALAPSVLLWTSRLRNVSERLITVRVDGPRSGVKWELHWGRAYVLDTIDDAPQQDCWPIVSWGSTWTLMSKSPHWNVLFLPAVWMTLLKQRCQRPSVAQAALGTAWNCRTVARKWSDLWFWMEQPRPS